MYGEASILYFLAELNEFSNLGKGPETMKIPYAKKWQKETAGIGVNGVETLNVTMVSNTSGFINEFDSSATASGTLDLQTSQRAPSGGYVFFATGLDTNGCPMSFGGVINVDGPGTISGNGSVFDLKDCTNSFAAESLDASVVIAPDSYGRIQVALTPSVASGVLPVTWEGYIVDARHIRLVETKDVINGTTGGTALGQGANAGTFNTGSIAGSTFVFGTTGLDFNWFFQMAGLVTADSNGNVSGNLNFNDLTGTGVQAPIPFSGNYTVDSTGRVTLTNLTDGTFNVRLQLYLTGDGNATVISMDYSDVLAGFGYRQTGGGSFTASSFSGKYGMNATGFGGRTEFDAVGPITADGIGTLQGRYDTGILSGTPRANSSLTGDFVADGGGVFTGTISGLDITTSANRDAFTYYVIDTKKAVAIETDPNQLTLGNYEIQH
jgi:hypothetical protein